MESSYEKGLSLDRIDPFGNYEPANCRWATGAVQNKNKRADKYLEVIGFFSHAQNRVITPVDLREALLHYLKPALQKDAGQVP